MADIFVSYARKDSARVEQLAEGLARNGGWSLFTDHVIPTGQSWREYIGAQLEEARCVLVIW